MITVGMFAKIRRMYFREQLSIREIERRTNLSRNTIRKWLREPAMTEPCYPERQAKSVVDAYAGQIRSWLQTDSHRPKRDRRTARVMFQAIQAQGYEWLAETCRQADMAHPEWPEMTIAEVLQDERLQLMPVPRAFDGYVEQPVRVSSTSLIHFQKNRYSVPTQYAHRVVSLHIYPTELVVVADNEEIARHERVFDRYVTRYDWQHYLSLIVQKPGALRNGAPFQTMPEPLLQLQRHLLKHAGGDRVMAQVLSAIPVNGIDAVLDAVNSALASGRPSGEHVLNVLGRIRQAPAAEAIAAPLRLKEEPQANVNRYERLRNINEEAGHVA